MDSNKKIDSEALELYENARQRLKQRNDW